MKPYNERLPLIDAAIEATDGDIERIKDYRKTDTYINYTVKLGYFSVDSQWACHGETICTHDEYEQRARELGYKPKEQDMNDWYDKGELPPVGEVCILVSVGFTELNHEVEITYMGDGVGCYRCLKSNNEYTVNLCDAKFRPLRTERDVLVEKAINVAGDANAECDMTFAGALIDAGWRPIKPMSEQEFMKQCLDICGHGDARLYRAGCRFIEQVKV